MTFSDINTILSQIAEQKTRERILEFSFTLLQWMGITPNAENKPQLLSTQTQKLKEYLANAPQTVQAQLYRMSADGQSIRVRFAVLKKLKKEYINQLVDNDPGLTSYQASVKGIINIPGRPQYIPSQPYYIHFVTTPDYDKLVLIFNQGEQKRIVSFRNRLTNTQYNKIIQQWQNIGIKPKPEIADLLWKSLDIKEVNKEFYKQIKERFDALVGIAKASEVNATENQLKQFTVRLIGRYIFCWFLKEKEIVPAKLISSEKIKNTPEFHQTYLQKLFFGILNSKIGDRDWLNVEPIDVKHLFEKIPYLNGGLFDKTTEDEMFASLELNKWLINFVEILENYDFTIDESSNQYQQVAVDPEMLGRIFENLLASQNPETEKAANNERKAFGAFYTPRDIVDYMVDESLKSYLANKLSISTDELSTPFSTIPVWPDKLNNRKQEADEALKNVKILDPACGSGAFPMGVLHRLIQLRELLSLQPNTYLLKKEILSKNIYGVDIMPMAVDIARLRTWLSLIVEEDYKGEKISSNFGIDALPNLDFKFMQGNSLLETYEGIKLFDEKLLQTKTNNKKQDLIENTKRKMNDLQSKYLTLHNTGQLRGTEKVIIEKELKESKDLLIKISKSKVEEPATSYGMFNKEESAVNISQRLQGLQKDFFSISDKERKKELKAEIETLEWDLIVTSLQESGKTDRIAELEKLKEQNIKPYFLYKLNFPEVFTEKGGFDIVIGNPPYVRQEAIDPYYKPKYIANHPEVGSGTADLYVYFFDSALSVTNYGGIIIFITLNKYLKTKYGTGLRKKLKDKNVDLIIDFFELPVFEASTDVAITKIINAPDTDSTRYFPVKSLDNLDLNSFTKSEPFKVIKDGAEWKFIDSSYNSILEKIYKDSLNLKEFTNDKIFRGIVTGNNDAFVLKKEIAEKLVKTPSSIQIKKFIKSKSFDKWNLNIIDYLLYIPWDFEIEKFPDIAKYLNNYKTELSERPEVKEGRYPWYAMSRYGSNYFKEFDNIKLIYIYTAKKHEFYFDTYGHYLNNNCYMVITDNKFLFFFLNSILFDWFKRIKFVAYGDADEGGRVKLDYNKMITVPIRQITEQQLKWFEKQYAAIKSVLGNESKVKALEQEAEIMLFKIYELTYDEVKIVCPAFSLSEEEYKAFKI
ncbi:MAG: Eco57I restriction-modification methylase domain-containing protein [Bacteroidia bacterium]|nr:Eco57I restriction-modification methylase domain-containing protein [Bacteroidia bacterium]